MAAAYKGDIGLFRACLMMAGFCESAEGTVFNDDSKAKPKKPNRRLKLWFASAVFDASQEQQWALEGLLREAFGDRILAMYFSESQVHWSNAMSLCIKLQD